MLSSRSVLCWLTDTVATRRQVEPSKSTVALLPQAPGIPSPCSAQAGPTCSKRPSVTLGHWAFQFIRCSSCHVMKPQGTLEVFQLKLNKNKLSGRNEHVPAVKHLCYLKCFLSLSVDLVNLLHFKLLVMIYCCNKSYAVISELTLVTLSVIPRGTSYHSYLIQNCKIYNCSLSVKWTQNYITQLLINGWLVFFLGN